jgi:hypothetical protein
MLTAVMARSEPRPEPVLSKAPTLAPSYDRFGSTIADTQDALRVRGKKRKRGPTQPEDPNKRPNSGNAGAQGSGRGKEHER